MDIDFLTQEGRLNKRHQVTRVQNLICLSLGNLLLSVELLEKLDKYYLGQLIQFISPVANMYL